MINIEIDHFLAEVCAGKSNETPQAYKSKLKRLDGFLEEQRIPLCSLCSRDLTRFINGMQERGLSPFTIHTVMMTVRHFLKWAHHAGMIADLHSGLKIPQTPRPEPKAIEAAAALRLMEAAARTGEPWERARNLALLYILRDTGGRISAIINSDIDQLDLKRGRLLVREKGNKKQFLYINHPTIAALREWLKCRCELSPKDKKIFIGQYGTGLKRSSIYSLLERIKANAPIIQGRSNPHSYRHAWARDALTNGEDISKVARTLGNSVRVTAEYYALWSDAELQKAHGEYSPGAKLPIIKPNKDS